MPPGADMTLAKVARLHRTGGPEVLVVETIAVRPPQAGEVRISVAAAGLNRSDSIYYHGAHPVQPVLPSLLGQEAAGRIESIGAGVTGLAIGDAVSLLPRMAPAFGTIGALIVAPAAYVIKHPPQLTMVEAAALWAPFLTAYGALFMAGNLRRGQTVVITAASSSVGLAAIQLANRAGATPIAVTRTDDKAERLRDAGAQHVIVTGTHPVGEAIRRLTDGRGADLVIDAVAGPGIIELAGAIAMQGRYVLYGILSGAPTPLPVQAAFASHLTFTTFVLDPAVIDFGPAIADIASGLASGALKPAIDRVYTLEAISEAFGHLESNRQFGKIVLTMDAP